MHATAVGDVDGVYLTAVCQSWVAVSVISPQLEHSRSRTNLVYSVVLHCTLITSPTGLNADSQASKSQDR